MKCNQKDCVYMTAEDIPSGGSISEHITMLGYHREDVHPKSPPPPQPVAAPAVARTEKFLRPKLAVNDGSVAEEDWEYFVNSWNEYKTLSGPGAHAKEILIQCLGDVGGSVFNRVGVGAYNNLSKVDLLREAKKLVVKKRNKLVNRLKFNAMVQKGDEMITNFETRLKPVARTGMF
jgi:hypothetical protein